LLRCSSLDFFQFFYDAFQGFQSWTAYSRWGLT
jgi:hypothetical protein